MRKIPATMATQHPDNALAPYWNKNGEPFISAYQEIEEAFKCFSDLGVSEYMWDWEGKHADAAVIDRLFSEYNDYFSKNQLGQDKFLTFRIPNIWQEKGYNLLQAMTVILSSEDFARDISFANRPLFEVILPMTEKADQLMHMQKLFKKLAEFKSAEFTQQQETNTDYLEIIPLVESVQSQLSVTDLLAEYVNMHKAEFGRKPEYIRTFLACSDSSLFSGSLAGILGNKVALSRLWEFSDQTSIDIFPIAGPGSLGFRGGLSPKTVERFIAEMPGVRTATVQSSFRYDHPLEEVKAAIVELEAKLPATKPRIISREDQEELINIANLSATNYKQTLQGVVADMRPVFDAMPKRRDRRQHIGLMAYGRSVSGESLPRAITLTGGFYSVGVPPEFIGLGRTLQKLSDNQVEVLTNNYKFLASDLEKAGRYLNRASLKRLSEQNDAWNQVVQDIELSEKILGLKFEPQTADEKSHMDLSAQILDQVKNPGLLNPLINKAAICRQSIG